jgi:hypothetical protein
MDSFIELFMVSPTVLVVLFFVAILAGFIDSLAGGGGLLTVPALMAGCRRRRRWRPTSCRPAADRFPRRSILSAARW